MTTRKLDLFCIRLFFPKPDTCPGSAVKVSFISHWVGWHWTILDWQALTFSHITLKPMRDATFGKCWNWTWVLLLRQEGGQVSKLSHELVICFLLRVGMGVKKLKYCWNEKNKNKQLVARSKNSIHFISSWAKKVFFSFQPFCFELFVAYLFFICHQSKNAAYFFSCLESTPSKQQQDFLRPRLVEDRASPVLAA